MVEQNLFQISKSVKMELETINLNQICRTCKSVTPQMLCLFDGCEKPHQGPRIDQMLMACASVQVICGDGLPDQICQICVEQLKNAFIFKRQCEKVDSYLREHAKNVKVHEIKQEFQNSDSAESIHVLNNIPNEQSSSKETIQENTNVPKIETDYIQFLDNNQVLLTCRECAKIFTTLEGLRYHKLLHTGEMYKCKQCDKIFVRLDHLQHHEQSHSRSKVYVCRICDKTLTTMKHLKRHLLTHLRQKPLSCNTCNRGFNRIEHLQNHTPRCKGDTVYPCDICNKAFNRKDSLEVHKTTHDNQTSKVLTIESLDNIEDHYYQIDQGVDSVFSNHTDADDYGLELQVEVTKSMDDDHIKEVTSLHTQSNTNRISFVNGSADNDNKIDGNLDKITRDLEESEEPVESKDIKVEEFSEPEEAVSEKEDKIFSAVEETDSDENPPMKIKKEEKDEEYGEFPCPACQEVFNTITSLDKHARIKHQGLKVHKCGVCFKEFGRANHLNRHLTSHSTIKLYQCHLCVKGFNRRDHLNKHQKVHERSNDLECDVCQRTFNRADYLAKHRASIHGIGEKVMSERKYECPLCYKSFTTEKNRDVHFNAHGDQKEYQCRVCEKTFPSKPRLTEHLKFHDENAKKYICSECGQRFIRNDFLVIHMRRHRGEKPFKCKYCGKGFPRTTDLTLHERYHTGEKTHLCTICGKGFGRAHSLTVHMRTHTGEKPYQCKYCDAAFAQGNDLKTHVRRHTGERFQCDICSDSFVVKYLLKQHKRTVHGLDVVCHIRRLSPVCKQEVSDEPPAVTDSFPKPVGPDKVVFDAIQ